MHMQLGKSLNQKIKCYKVTFLQILINYWVLT